MFALLQTVIGFQLGYIMCCTNQITPAINAKFGWDEKDATMHQSVIGSSAKLSLIFSAAFSGQIVKYGRRRALIVSAIVGILGAAITMF